MSNIEISPEDRERLAKTKFGEWFDEFFEKKFEEAFAKKTTEAQRSERTRQPQRQRVDGEEQPPAPPPQQHRKRSLLEVALSDTFGL
jgi:hypothetical protein